MTRRPLVPERRAFRPPREMPVTPEPATQVTSRAEPITVAPALDGSTGESAVVVEHLTKRFGDRIAFDDLTFEVGYGEVFGFLGPNGAGKTTTVRTLGTLIAPTSGSATVAGIPLAPENGADIRSRISIMPESPGLYSRLSVAENLQCFADLYELPDPRGADRPGAQRRQPDRPGRRPVRHAVQGSAPAGRARAGVAQRPGGVVPRRADVRPRSGGQPRSARTDRHARARAA